MERVWVVRLVWAAMVAGAWRGTKGCVEKERIGLLELQKAMPPGQFTALHGESDCCFWLGVDCSASTGRVRNLTFSPVDWKYKGYFLNISLLLPFEELAQLDIYRGLLDGLINLPDLTKLTRLEALSITGNNLTNIASLQGICKMKSIVALQLSFNNIRAHLPPCIGNLTYLRILDISYNHIIGNIPSTIGNLSHLNSLSLQGNFLSGSFSLHSLANNSKLERLELFSMDNDFQVETETQSWVPSFQLSYLDLSRSNLNKMSGSVIPTFLSHQYELKFIDLSHNKLRDTFPSWLLQNGSKLESLLMSNNSLTGNLILTNIVHGLKFLRISDNNISGELPDNLLVFLPTIESIDLSFNSFIGKLPKSLFVMNNGLFFVDFSNNLLEGKIYLNHTALPDLNILNLSNNKFNGSIEELPSSSLRVLYLSGNLISGKLPKSLGDFSFLYVLQLSKNSFEGGIPNELCRIVPLVYLDISHNNFSGSIPSCLKTSSIRFLNMRNCGLSGVIPRELFSNSMLITLDLSYNDFSRGVLPNWIYGQHNLQALLIAGLRLEGEIPTQLCGLENIKIMDLSHNNFNGSIPSCLFTRPLWVSENRVNYVDFRFSSFWVTYLFLDNHLILGVNFTTKGRPSNFQGGVLNLMKGLDVSSNNLSGQIPPQIGDSKAIKALNLSNNRLWGSIPSNISRLIEIESLDLSSNNLSGEIPSEIVDLTFLSIFNVSNNNLSGPIPNEGQFSNFDEQNYGGNELLCGPRLQRHCTTSSSPPTTPPDEQDNNDETIFERTSFWWSFIAAYVTVVISLVVLVGIDTRCSRVWFVTVDAACSILVCVFVKMKIIIGMK